MEDDVRRRFDSLVRATRCSDIYYYRIELVNGGLEGAKADLINIWETLGYEGPQPTTFAEAFGTAIVADDQPRAMRDIMAALSGEAPSFVSEYRIRYADGSLHWNLARGTVLRDADGVPTEILGTSVDISELKRVQERLELAIVGSNTATWDVEIDPENFLASEVHYTNVGEILGYGTDFKPTWGDGMAVFHHDDRAPLVQSCIELFASDRREWDQHVRLLHRNGSVLWFYMRGVVTRDDAGKPVRFTGVSIEVTERKVLAEALRVAKDRLELGLRSSGLGLFDIRFATPTAPEERSLINVFEPLGYEPDDGARAADTLMFPEDRPALQDHMRRYLAGEVDHYEIEHRHRHRDGSERWKLARGLAIRDAEGKPERLIGCLVDISERKKIEKTLRETEQRYRRIFDNAAVGMAITDSESNFIELNDRLCKFYGYSQAEARHFRMEDRSLDGVDEERAKLGAVVSGDAETFTVDKRFRRKDGQIVWHQLTASAVMRDENGRATEMLGIVQNITDRKTLELELHAAREAAEAANRAKDKFLAHVSHEIRTPLNAILGMTELAMDTTGEHQRQLLHTARSAAGNLLEIINDLLDFSKIEAGKLSLHVADFSLRAMLADLVRGLAPRAQAKALVLRHDISRDVPDVLRGDEGRLRQILVNLLGNAIKFTPSGEARLEIRSVDHTAERAILVFEIHDTGIGVAKDRQAAIFRAFEQADASTTRKYGGTGLGLTISTQIAALMGGGISVVSEVGRGSTFVLTVPFALGDAVPEHSVDPKVHVPLAFAPRILVAEDNELNIAVVREILNQRGYCADYAANGRAALELVARDEYDLLLLDLHMPELDGFDVVRTIRERETARHLPIIALTARSAEKDREEALAAGMDEFLSKPINVTAFWAAVDRLLTAYPPRPRPVSLLDRATIARVSGGRADALARLVGVFRATLPSQLARGHAAFDDHDFERLRDAAHRLHGTLATFSSIAGAAALELEDACTRGERGRCREMLGELDRMSAELLESTLQL